MTNQDIAVLTTCKHGKNWQEMQDDRCEADNSEYDRYGSTVDILLLFREAEIKSFFCWPGH